MDTLIEQIKAYCEARAISLTTFGSYAVRDGKFVERLERGGQCLPSTAARVLAYMDENPIAKVTQ